MNTLKMFSMLLALAQKNSGDEMHSTSIESKTTVLKSSIYSESTDSEWPAATVPQ